MTQPGATSFAADVPADAEPGRSALGLGFLAMLLLVPVTMPVPVLRGLVQERFAVSSFETHLFMAINMLGALVAAPIAGAMADRFGRRRPIVLVAIALDACCFLALAAPVPFLVFMAIRFVEGCAHITALSLVLSLAADRAGSTNRARAMGFVGAGLTLGVALGAPIGGQLGRIDPIVPLYAGAAVGLVALVVALFVVPEVRERRDRPSWQQIVGLVRADGAVAVPLAYAFVDRFTVGFFTTTFPLFARTIHELPTDRIGMLLGMFLGPFALLSYPFGRLSTRVSRSALMGGGSAAYGIGVMTLGWWDAGALPIVMIALGVLSAVMFVPSLVMITDLVRPEIRGVAMGGFNSAGSLGFLVGPIVGGAVVSVFEGARDPAAGYRAAFATAGVAELVCVLVTLPLLLRLVAARRTT